MPRLLNLSSVASLARRLHGIQNRLSGVHEIQVGIPKDAPAYPDGTNLAMVAAVNEFGSMAAGIPERSFLRKAVYSNAAKYHDLFQRASKRVLEGEQMAGQLQRIGLVASQDVKRQIDATLTPPNAPYTIRLKKSSHPLIDTGHLRQQVTYVLRKKKKNAP